MANHPEKHGNLASETQGNSSPEQRDQSGGSTQMQSGQQHKDNRRSSPDSSTERSDSTRQSGQTGSQHTNAGNTGFGSGQISPKTQNQPVPARSPGGSGHDSSGSDKNT